MFIVFVLDFNEFSVGFCPFCSVLRHVGLEFYRSSGNGAHLSKSLNLACRLDLHEHVAEGCTFDRTADYRHVKRIGGVLHEVLVEGASADDMELLDAERSHALEDLHYLTVSQCEASEYESAIFCRSLRYGLTCLCAIVVDGCSHRSRMAEACCVWVDETVEVCGGAESDEFRRSFRCILELLAALLEYPETADVLEESCGTLDSTLVGEILTETLVGDDGIRSLDAEK